LTRIVAPLVPAQDVSLWWIAKVKLPRERKPWPIDVVGFGDRFLIASWYAAARDRRLPCNVVINGGTYAASILSDPLSLVLEAPKSAPQAE